jgi:phosphate transport system substrate-binding protein
VKGFIIILIIAVGLIVVSVGLGGRQGGAVNIVGSTSIQPFAEIEAQAFQKSHPGEFVDVQGGGSTAGLQAAATGIAEVGMCSRGLTDKEEAETFKVKTAAANGSVAEQVVHYQFTVIARDGLAVIVHGTNPVSNLTLEQIRQIFAGDTTNWSELGGPDAPIRLITREEGSGTREAFQKLVMHKTRISRKALTQESNGSVKELVKNDPCGIGYMSLGLVGDELKALHVGGVAPTVEEVMAGRYPLVRPFLFVTRGPPSPRAQAFIDYVLSDEGQRMLVKEGLVGIGAQRKDH